MASGLFWKPSGSRMCPVSFSAQVTILFFPHGLAERRRSRCRGTMTTQAKNSLKYPPHQWFDIQKSSLAKESQTQRRNFRRAHPDLAAPAPRFSPDELEDPAKTIVLPSEIFAATWTASISRVGTMQGTSCWRQNPQKGPAPHLIPPRPVVHCSSTGEIYELGGPVHPQDNLALPQVRMAPDFKAKVSWPKLPDCGQRVAGIPMQVASPAVGARKLF